MTESVRVTVLAAVEHDFATSAVTERHDEDDPLPPPPPPSAFVVPKRIFWVARGKRDDAAPITVIKIDPVVGKLASVDKSELRVKMGPSKDTDSEILARF